MFPTLLILSAGLGSRYGSLKQIDRIGPSGERIIDYSVYDAIKAGFKKVVYVIRESFEEEFKEVIINELPEDIITDYVCQELNVIPSNITYSKERVKPWGTGHALLVAANKIKEPFAVINADDFYGAESFKIAADFLNNHNDQNSEYALIGYKLKNTLSDYGTVSRGICELDSNNYLISVTERTKIGKINSSIYFEDDNGSLQPLNGNEIVSMNMFALNPSVFNYFEKLFAKFMEENMDNLKAEFFLPSVINNMIENKKAKVKVLNTKDNWFGLTYQEDKPLAREKIKTLVEKKIYPVKLWA
ncbi:nucleotidyltransferase [candidate division KSB1 bacterium]|nr:MAG: nucleotidyltransferase [candidate division KSB1 bacterium]